jgi:iron-sulfur cluster repair protein YtfE (RIC family)
MLRDKNLVPLSRQHQHALALCVRIGRAVPIGDADLAVWQAEISQLFQSEISIHFVAEEQALFPVAREFAELIPLAEELLADHAALRGFFASAEARTMSAAELSAFGQQMSAHIRKEERQLFERMQELMTEPELSRLGHSLEEALKDAAQACLLPTAATRLHSAK